MIYVTGDCHGDWHRFSSNVFPEQKEMSKNDYVIVCGDFGIWHDTSEERWWLDWLNDKPFTTLFVDGNHENFDRLYSEEFPKTSLYGGTAQPIRDSVIRLCRGEVYTIDSHKIFTFGGASSHDIKDGIVEPDDFPSRRELIEHCRRLDNEFKLYRVNHMSWWDLEMPTQEEMAHGLDVLKNHDNTVDFVISHCCPQHIASVLSHGLYKPDYLTSYFNDISTKIKFKKWFFGHYHTDAQINQQYIALYSQILRIV